MNPPQCTLDINGNLGINNTQIVDRNRNMMNIETASVLKLGVNNTNPTYTIDVNGNARFNAPQIVMNSNVILMSTRGVYFTDAAYYRIADVKGTNDVNNFGALVIEGDLGNRTFDTSGHIHIAFATRDAQVRTGKPYANVAHVWGASPAALTPLIDILLFENVNNSYSIYVKTALYSYFNIRIQGGPLVNQIYSDWLSTKSLDVPSGVFKQSLINDINTFSGAYDGTYSIGNHTMIGGDITNAGVIRSLNSPTQGVVSLEAQRVQDASFLTVNGIRPSGSNSWQAQIGSKSALQLEMRTSPVANAIGSGFYFNSYSAIPGTNDALIPLSNLASIRPDGAEVRLNTKIRGQLTLTTAEDPINNVTFKYTHIGNNSLQNALDINFVGLNMMTLTTASNIGIGKRQPIDRLDVAGNAQFDGILNLATNDKSKKLLSTGFVFQFQTISNSTWIKLAYLEASTITPFNRGVIAMTGTLVSGADGMHFKLTMNYDASSAAANYILLEYHKNATNYFRSVFDVVAYVDQSRNLHVFAKSSASVPLAMNIDSIFTQSFGVKITTFTKTIYAGIVFSDLSVPITTLDATIATPVQFVVSVQNSPNTQYKALNNLGWLGLGTDNPASRLHVKDTTTTDSLVVTTGSVTTTSPNGFTINGNTLVNDQGKIVMAAFDNGCITYNLLDIAAVSNILNSVRLSNIHPLGTNVGISTPIPQYNLDITGTVALRSNAGRVLLTTGSMNGLGINKNNPQFTLDIGGDYNFTGKIYRNGLEFYTHPFSDCNNTLYFGSNVALGPGVINPDETLSVLSTLSLSNASGKTVFTSSNSFVGINVTNPKATIDVGGTGIAIHGTPIIDQSRNFSNVNTLTSDILTLSRSNIGINNRTPRYTIDLNGDMHFTGNLYKNNILYISSQWVGSNLGITYHDNVGIKIPVIPNESLCVFHNISLSNMNGKSVATLAPDGSAISLSTPFIATDRLTLCNQTGQSYVHQLNGFLGVQMASPANTLDVNGTIGMSGTTILNNARTLSNITTFYSDLLTAQTTMFGVGTRNPVDTMTLVGTLGISNVGYSKMTTVNNNLLITTNSVITNNIVLNPTANTTGLVVSTGTNTTPGIGIVGSIPQITLTTNVANNASLIAFRDTFDNIARIGLDGIGYFNAPQTMTISTNNDMRFMTNDVSRMRIKKDGTTGFGTDNPNFTVDIGGTGLGIGRAFAVDGVAQLIELGLQ